uniref:Leucine rich repeat containing 31 n=1 Tax=Lepisosteus oculatus TaxID=7918 RepID=W5MJW2_LEPOC|nr:PREDICTED: leucine-rich repeat-containing protein 31 [Lepisosteus oculatus]XP_015216825.1 PREDICTED: leucine-rich repeat-containing protein 31 [Lepisosteus oculatus]XP_015216826.1 PREDICTED: leucine-rich repeat-containing protein 31 [Lepisosteus oculatus]
MEHLDSQRRDEGSQKRSPFDLIMNQIRRKKSFTESRQRPSVSRFFWPSENSEKRGKGNPETKECESKESSPAEDKENVGPQTGGGDPADSDVCSVVGWGRVKQFAQKLGKRPDRQTLSLSHCDLTATDVVELATMLPFLALLEELDLSWNDLIGGSLKALTFHLQHVNKLKTLKLSNCRLTVEDVTALGEALDYIPMLEVLDLSWNSCIGGNLQCLARCFVRACKVKEFHLVDCQLTAEDAETLGQVLCMMPHLEVLDLSANKLLAGGLRDLTLQLRHTPRLRALRLHLCGLQQDSIHTLGSAFQFLPDLQQLDLSCNKEAAGGFAQGAALMIQLKHLQLLDLHLCCLTEEDMAALNQVAPSLCDLRVLDLSSNKKIGGVSQQLFPSLPLSKMRQILLYNCCLTGDSYRSLAEAMQQLCELETLNLSWNKCVGGNLKMLLDSLKPKSRLQELKLSSCNLTTEDMVHLASVSRSGALVHLKHLDLTYNDTVGDQGWAHFFQRAEGLRELVELDLSLRPSARRDASPWLGSLLSCLPRLAALADLGMHRWVLTAQQRASLEAFNRDGKRNITFSCYQSSTGSDEGEPDSRHLGSTIEK